mmetsp:Transcript_25166/g.78972  ORF Transcript_25166/g.78972 Transcript_25166/m.78972 type:complete len:102 (+) Transcript_25166:1105-1410(+)
MLARRSAALMRTATRAHGVRNLPRALGTTGVPKDFAAKGHAEEDLYFAQEDAHLREKMKKMMDAAIKAETVAKADLDKMLAEHSIALPEDLKAKIIDWKLH